MSNGNDLIGGLLGLGALGLIGYAGFKIVETHGEARLEQQRRAESAQQARLLYLQAEQQREQRALENRVEGHIRRIDSAIDSMLENEDSIAAVIGHFVPDMDETNWEIFIRLLTEKAKASEAAQVALCIANVTRTAASEVTQIIGHSLDEAVELARRIWGTKDEVERMGFVFALRRKAECNVRARALLGSLMA